MTSEVYFSRLYIIWSIHWMSFPHCQPRGGSELFWLWSSLKGGMKDRRMLDKMPLLALNQHETMHISQVCPSRKGWSLALLTQKRSTHPKKVWGVGRGASVSSPEISRSLTLSIRELTASCVRSQKEKQHHSRVLTVLCRPAPLRLLEMTTSLSSASKSHHVSKIQTAFGWNILYKVPFAMGSFLAFSTALPPTGGNLTKLRKI